MSLMNRELNSLLIIRLECHKSQEASAAGPSVPRVQKLTHREQEVTVEAVLAELEPWTWP